MSTPALLLPLNAAPTWEGASSRAEWEKLFARAHKPAFTQAWCYGEGKAAEGWRVERLILRDNEGPAALCQLLIKRPMGIPVTRINRGPVFLREPTPEYRLEVLRALRRRWRFGLGGLLLIAPSLPAGVE